MSEAIIGENEGCSELRAYNQSTKDMSTTVEDKYGRLVMGVLLQDVNTMLSTRNDIARRCLRYICLRTYQGG